MIPQKLSSQTELTIDAIDLTQMHDIIVIVKQSDSFYKEIADPAVTDAHNLIFGLSADDASLLNYKKPVSLQVLWTDANGMAGYTEIVYTTVDQILREGKYGN